MPPRRSASLFLPFAPSLCDVPSALVYFADSRHLAGKKEDGRGGGRMRGPFEVAASPCFCSLGFLTVAFLYLLPSTAARAPRQPRPALSVFVCFMAAPFVPVDDPFSLSVSLRSFPSNEGRSSFAFFGQTSSRSLRCLALLSITARSLTYGIAPSLGIVLQPCPVFVGKCGPPKVFA